MRISKELSTQVIKSFNYGASFQLAVLVWKLIKTIPKKNKNIQLFEDEKYNAFVNELWTGKKSEKDSSTNTKTETATKDHDEMTKEEIKESYNKRLLTYDYIKKRISYIFTPPKGLGEPRPIYAKTRFKKRPLIISKSIKKVIKFGLFLATWSGSTNLLMKKLNCSPLIAGLISGGFSQLAFNSIDFKVAIYCAIRALASLYFMSKLPTMKPWLAYVVVNLVIAYFIDFDIFYVEPSYRSFLNYLCVNDHESLQYLTQTTLKRNENAYFPKPRIAPVQPCCPVIHKNPSCFWGFFERGFETYKRAIKVYSSFYFITFAIKLSSSVKKKTILRDLKNFVVNVAHSTAFIGSQVTFTNPTFCLSAKYTKVNSYPLALSLWGVGSTAILFERPSRRPELALFSLWKVVLMVMYRLAGQQTDFGDFKPTVQRVISSLCMSLATGVWLYIFQRNKRSLKSLDALVVNSLFSSSFATTLPFKNKKK
mmetsp:Transcript_6445/g.9383  ORF Transcript_6445/g.9383 Transcript_6445/m.9383 type:complete len:480 (+) Transcript_6445:177-1616(+)